MEEAENTTVSWDFCPIERPQHLPNITSDGAEDDQCYPMRTAEETTIFFNYEKMVGLWGNICVGILGLLGNLVNVVVLGQKDMRKNCFNQLLIGQNVYDSLHIIFAILDTIRTSFFEGFYPKFMLPSFPWFHYPLYRISLVGSIYMTVATAIERYLAVCSPHNYHQMNMASQMRYIYYVVPVTVAATAVNVPRFFESEYAWRNCTVNGTIYSAQKVLDVTDLRMERKYIIGYVHWTWTITTVIVPFILLVFLSVKIFLGLRKVRKNLNRHKRLQIKAEAKALTNDSKNPDIVKGTDNGEDEILNDIEASKIVTCSTMVNGNGSNGKGSNGNVSIGKGSNGNVSNGNGSNGIRRSIPSIIINPDPEMIPMDDLVQDETPEPNGNTLAVESQNSSKRNSRSNSGSEPGLKLSFNRARIVAQRKLQSAVQSREANMALILVCTVIMFVICHAPRLMANSYEAAMQPVILDCMDKNKMGFPLWFIYFTPIIKFLQVINCSSNFAIYFVTGSCFRNTLCNLVGYKN